ncbi:MAG TPA: nuclear transport factor 2 family protein [Pirellulales bacterium]|jgi:calcium/calmodulin-dependent protein kinase (CaM kinase) II|nr:nuclear transport factor 2 family protein [Pirellulales bacterium]
MSTTDELLAINQRLLDAIARADWPAYQELCDPALTCFEPESRGQLVEGMAFHKFYFDLGADGRPVQNTMASPRVRLLGDDAALIAYVRLVQRLGADEAPKTVAVEETRLWQRTAGKWRHVHLHRSLPGG